MFIWARSDRLQGGVEFRHEQEASAKVLIVDDSPMSIKLMQSCLRHHGCETTVMSQSLEAVKEIIHTAYDLVVLDWQMPDMNGSEALRSAQNIISYDGNWRLPWVTSRMPVLIYSGQNMDPKAWPKCQNFEIVGHIQKSIRYNDLRDATSNLLRELNLV